MFRFVKMIRERQATKFGCVASGTPGPNCLRARYVQTLAQTSSEKLCEVKRWTRNPGDQPRGSSCRAGMCGQEHRQHNLKRRNLLNPRPRWRALVLSARSVSVPDTKLSRVCFPTVLENKANTSLRKHGTKSFSI